MFWEDLALDLLEKNLNGFSLNADSLKTLFKERPDILEDLDIQMDGNEVDDTGHDFATDGAGNWVAARRVPPGAS